MVLHSRSEERLLAVRCTRRWRRKLRSQQVKGYGSSQFLPFGLCNAPANFHRLMETVLRGLTYD
jgi:hypothetical protein